MMMSELEQIQSKSPDKLTKIMQAFSEEDDAPRLMNHLHMVRGID